MKKPNAAELIREMLGCYNIMLHKPPVAKKPKTVGFGENIRMAAARARATPARLLRHQQYLAAH